MYQNVETWISAVKSARINIKLPAEIVYCVMPSPPHATSQTSNMHRSNKEQTSILGFS